MNKHIVAAAAVFSLLASQPAVADSVSRESVINQSGEYETTLKFVLHPARLEWSATAPNELGEHPAVLVNRNSSSPSHASPTKAYPHPARLELSAEAPVQPNAEEPRG